jgi:small subunit ribosomal protein S16
MLKIRFFRTGKKHQPFYRVRVVNKNNPPASGRFIEDVGFYNPRTKECELKQERILHWIESGAQPSDRVNNLLIKKQIIRGKKVDVVSLTKKRQEKMTKKAEEKKTTEEAVTSEEEPKKEEEEKKEPEKEEVVEDKKEEVKEEPKKEEKESEDKKEK